MELIYFSNVVSKQQKNYEAGKPVSFSKTSIQKAIDLSDALDGTEPGVWADKLLKHMVKGNPWAAGQCLKNLSK